MSPFSVRALVQAGLGLLIVFSVLPSGAQQAAQPANPQPAWVATCGPCHAEITESYRRHGMSRSLGRVEDPPVGKVINKKTGWQYDMALEGDSAVLTSTAPDGGIRRQKVVGRLGAGIFDRSWSVVELDPITDEPTDRLFFAPVESITGHGLELSPFEYSEYPSGPNFPLDRGCLGCHTRTRVSSLPDSAMPSSKKAVQEASPANALGANAFNTLEPLGCSVCHGRADRHVELAKARGETTAPWTGDLGLEQLASLDAPLQRDVCARCHLQGDARFNLKDAKGATRIQKRPWASRFPAMIAARTPAQAGDDFRFVGQLERLALSSCFRSSPAMTCTTCHDAHLGAGEQGIASFERACQACHGGAEPATAARSSAARSSESRSSESQASSACSRPADLTVQAVTGTLARGEAGCVDCHVRRSQPFDLPGVRSTDHFVRRSPPLPQDDVPFRAVTDSDSPLVVYDDGRLKKVLATPAGQKWQRGLAAMAYAQVGRFEEAAAGFASFPPPGTAAARRPTAPSPLAPLEIQVLFHEQRALAYLSTGDPGKAKLAFDDALAIDPTAPGALVGRARLALGSGDFQTVLLDTQKLIDLWPGSESPWEIRERLAQRIGRRDLLVDALEAQTARWPANAEAWMRYGLLKNQDGDAAEATRAFEYVRRLSPLTLERQAPPTLSR